METHALASSYSLRSGVRPSSSVPLPSTHGLSCKQRHGLGFLLYSSRNSCLPASRRAGSSVAFVPRAAAEVIDGRPSLGGGEGGRGRGGKRVLRQSQAHTTSPSLPVKEIASFAVPAGALLAVSFGMWIVFPIQEIGLQTDFRFYINDLFLFIDFFNFVEH